jgi:hypothetical protein
MGRTGETLHVVDFSGQCHVQVALLLEKIPYFVWIGNQVAQELFSESSTARSKTTKLRS